MSTATIERPATEPSDAQILAKLRRTTKGKTAAELGVPLARMHAMPGVKVVGYKQTGKRGRPPVLFGAEDVSE